MKGSGKLGFYREKVSDFIGIVRAQGIREAMAVAKKFLNRRVDSQEGSREETESVPPFPEGCIRVLDISYYINCPPTSGGSLRIINPLTRMSPEDGISVDFVFSTWGMPALGPSWGPPAQKGCPAAPRSGKDLASRNIFRGPGQLPPWEKISFPHPPPNRGAGGSLF